MEPYRPRPETTASVARSLVTGALGLKSTLTREQRDEERKKLKDAKGEIFSSSRVGGGGTTLPTNHLPTLLRVKVARDKEQRPYRFFLFFFPQKSADKNDSRRKTLGMEVMESVPWTCKICRPKNFLFALFSENENKKLLNCLYLQICCSKIQSFNNVKM